MSRKPRRQRKNPPAQDSIVELSKIAQPYYPGSLRGTWISRAAGIPVNEDTALTLSAVWACVRLITEAEASLPWHVFRRRPDGGRDSQDDNPIDWLLHVQANPEMSAFQFRETILAHALTWGNGYAEIERDGAGRPLWLWHITPERVQVRRDASQQLVYDISNAGQSDIITIPAADMFHLKGLGFDGLVGYSVIRLAARSIGLGMAADDHAARHFSSDASPSGILKHPQRLTDMARQNLAEDWQRRHGGQNRRRFIAILEEGMEWVPTSLPPEDSQLLESRQFTPTEIARWFRVPPHKIADLTRATFSNIEEQNIEFVVDTVMPWALRLEQEANIKLFGRKQQGVFYTKHNFNARLRGNTAARTTFFTAMLDRGVFSVNDVRELEDLNPIGPDGDKRFVQSNMQLLAQAGEETAAPELQAVASSAQEAPPSSSQSNGQAEESMPMPQAEKSMSHLLAGWQHVFDNAWKHLLRREQERLDKAIQRSANAQDFNAWLGDALAEHWRSITQVLQPLLIGAATSVGRHDAAERAQAVLDAQRLEIIQQQRQRAETAFAAGLEAIPWVQIRESYAANLLTLLTQAPAFSAQQEN